MNANPVFEHSWTEAEAEAYERQLVRLGGALRDLQIPLSRCSLFAATVGHPVSPGDDCTWCGSGQHMTAVAQDGRLYACNRFAPSGVKSQPELPVGDVWSGINPEAIQPWLSLIRSSQRPPGCQGCQIESGCAWCKGWDYDSTGGLSRRTTTICLMHKARVRALKTLGVLS